MENEDYRYLEYPDERVMMDCGHMSIYKKTLRDKPVPYEVPVCVKCGCYKTETGNVDLSKRIARCNMCGKEVQSDVTLNGFHYLKKKNHDIFYCGCLNENFLGLMNIAKTT